MNAKRFCFVGSIVVLVMVALGCGQAPQKEHTAAKAALEAAEAMNAADYAPDEWMRAEQAFQAAEAAINAENTKTGFMRSYDKAKELLTAAQDAAETALHAAEAAREEAKRNAPADLEQLNQKLTEAEELLTQLEGCRKKGSIEEELAQARTTLDEIKPDVEGVATAIESEDYLTANRTADKAGKTLEELMLGLNKAKEDSGC